MNQSPNWSSSTITEVRASAPTPVIAAPSGDADDPLAETAAWIRALPNFEAAALHYISGALSWREGSRLINKLSSSHARSLIVGLIAYLHFEREAEGGDGATYPALWRYVLHRKSCGAGVLKTLLALLRLAGFVSVRRSDDDRRLKLYRPTDKMLRFMRGWYAQTFGCFDIIDPGHGYAQRVWDDHGFLAHVVVSIARPYYGRDIRLTEHFPLIHTLCTMDSGFTTAATLVEAELTGAPIAAPQVLAARFGSSISQARNVLRTLAESGLVALSDQGRVVDAKPLAGLFMDYIARELALYGRYALAIGPAAQAEARQA